ncbi:MULTISPECIES: hypothetical protein [Methylorubrum]|uniref:Uncharacterized protein n=1 Tax=Methylorubrum suomiense TaxID=144191 RepID=A0ABQ4V1P7_9HYPH|nr:MULTISPECIES: hypothetical protein [Methylobacteriaceae]GJE78230.1 hypothetical protein BGCPKDLD_4844 [Methylorubrum suomiense]
MSVSRRREQRLLDTHEAELVARSHRPDLSAADDAQISELIRLLRERRDRARDVSRRQRREVRGKAAPSGARPASDNSGTREKAALLAAAVKRVSKERERRRSTTASHARRALSMKRAAGDPAANRPMSRTSSRGMHPVADDTRAPSGALNEEGQEIARRRGGGPR